MSDEEWQSFSNWCPGDVIDNRIIRLGAMKAGEHSVKISVPEAVFPEQQGDIPVSMFFQGLKTGEFKDNASIDTTVKEPMLSISRNGDSIVIGSDEDRNLLHGWHMSVPLNRRQPHGIACRTRQGSLPAQRVFGQRCNSDTQNCQQLNQR